MKPENIMLLGFINKAADYLKSQSDDSAMGLSQTDNENLNLLKDQLNKKLDASLDDTKQTAEQLLQAGYDAFDNFIETHQSVSLVDEIDKLFDVNFDNETSEDDITNLFDSYQNPVEIEIDEKDEESFMMSDEDQKLLELISENVMKVSNQNETEINKEEQEISFDTIYSKLTEDNNVDNIVFSNPGQKYDEVVFDKEDYECSSNIGFASKRKATPVNLIEEEENDVLKNVFSEKPIEQPDKDDIINLVKQMQKSDEQYYEHIFENEIEDELPEEEEIQEKPKPHSNLTQDIIEDLKKKMMYEDEIKRQKEYEFSQIYQQIHEVYPYLSEEFVRNTYYLKDNITNEYPLNIKVIILHRVCFKNVETLRQFVEIALNHSYSINADENKLIVDVFKQHYNTDGKILSSIFEIANQSSLLEAEYEGYRVLYEDES